MDGFGAVLAKALAFIMIIVTGYVLKRKGFFHASDFYLISKIVIRITLPAAIVSNFSQITMDSALLWVIPLGIGANVIMVACGYLINLRKAKSEKVFDMVNVSGYNIGNFTLPFVQSFLGPVGFAATSLFDAGNAVMCTGVTYTLASIVKGDGESISFGGIMKRLFSSIPFDAYIVMTILAVLRIPLPQVILNYAETMGKANAFLALLMLGIGFEVYMERDKLRRIIKIMVIRYGMALLFALAAYYLLPFPLEVRQTLAIVAFGPISSVSPAFTANLEGDVELSSAINSISIVMSIITITVALVVIL
ncbi:MAG: AEC family transporter [Lachnospiraceae bacterium]